MRKQSSRVGAARSAMLLVLFGLLLVGCLGRSPEVDHFMLGTGEPEGRETSGARSELAVLIGPVRLPAYLERPQIVSLGAAGEVQLDEYSRWLGGFEENFLRAISLGLARRLDSIKVVTHPSSAPFPFDYRVRLHVDDLVFVADRDVLRVRIRWALVREGKEVAPELFLMETSPAVEDDSVEARVEAHEAVISELVGRIADEIRRLEDSEQARTP